MRVLLYNGPKIKKSAKSARQMVSIGLILSPKDYTHCR